ncbi:sensor histidine kinase [Demequina sp. SO4-13]|uniref:sensor histidine kinase n=1 Tax=Demequina sp. SO4-13 TaxID=3401027 RepID=UPI003AF6E0EA
MPTAARSPQRGDLVLGAVVAAIALAMLVLIPALTSLDREIAIDMPGPGDWQWWLAVIAVLAQGVGLVWISAAPRRVLVAVAAFALLISLIPMGEASGISLVAVIAAAYRATRKRASAESWMPWIVATVVTAVAGAIANLRLDDGLVAPTAAAIGQALVVVGIPTAIAAAVGARRAVAESRERESLSRARELEARTEAAIAAERTAIARELHDIAAHHLSGIALMSSAISQQIDTDPATAKAGLADVRAQTRTLLDELRGLVALLRTDPSDSIDSDSPDGTLVNVESLPGLETLIPAARARGLDVSLTVADGASIRELSQGIGPLGQFAAYRTVQEALANAARHDPAARCTVELRDASGGLEIVVTNGPGTADAAGAANSAEPAGSLGPASSAGAANSAGSARSAHSARSAGAANAAESAGALVSARAAGTLDGARQPGFGLRGMEERAALTRSALSYGPTEDGGWRVALRVPREAREPGESGSSAEAGRGSGASEGTRS